MPSSCLDFLLPGAKVWGRGGVLRFVIFLASLSMCTAKAQEFEATGELVFYLNHFNEWDRYETNQFHITVSGCNWLLRLTPIMPKPYCDYRELSYDGTYVYSVASFEKIIEAQRTNRSANVATATITEGPVPHDESVHEAGVLWIMFASSCYLSSVTNQRTEPAITFGVPSWQYSFANRYTVKTVFKLQEKTPAVPESLIYFDEGFMRDPARSEVVTKREAPYDAGFTNAVYRVLQSTNCGDLRLPTRAILETYVPARTVLTETGRFHLNIRYWINVDGVRAQATPNPNFRPKLPGMTMVSDRRALAGVPPYLTRQWLTVMQAQQTGRTPPTSRMHRVVRYLVLGLMATLSGVPLLVFLYRKKRQPQR